MFATARVDTTLFEALVDARRQHGGGHVDRGRPRHATDDLQRAHHRQLCVGRGPGATHAPGRAVGVLLPTSRASLVTFFALQAERRVPAMLNFSTGAASACAACRAAEVAVVITARRFVDKAKLEPLIAALASQTSIVYLEDVRAGDRPAGSGWRHGCAWRSRGLGMRRTRPTTRPSCSLRQDPKARRRASC